MNLVEFVTSKYDGRIEISGPILIPKTEILWPEEECGRHAQDQFDDPL